MSLQMTSRYYPRNQGFNPADRDQSSPPVLLANLVRVHTGLAYTPADVVGEITSALAGDALAQKILVNGTNTLAHPWSWEESNKLLLHGNLVYIPDVDNLRARMVSQHHDAALAGHPGVAKTTELLSRNYYFPVCMDSSRNTSLLAKSAPALNPRATDLTVSSCPCQSLSRHGKAFPATLSQIYHPQKVALKPTTQFSYSSTG